MSHSIFVTQIFRYNQKDLNKFYVIFIAISVIKLCVCVCVDASREVTKTKRVSSH